MKKIQLMFRKIITGAISTLLGAILIFAGGAIWRVEALHTKVRAVEVMTKHRFEKVEAEQLYYRETTRKGFKEVNDKLDRLIMELLKK